MPKVEVSVAERAKEFYKEGFYVSGTILMCKYCDCRLEHKRKDSLKKRCASEKHVKGRTRPTQRRQVTLEESTILAKCAKDFKQEFILATTETFIKANIPVEKLDNPTIREWMNTYVKGSGDLPTANRLRQHYIPQIGEKRRAEIKESVFNQDVSILCDETTDKSGRCVFNILVRCIVAAAEQKTYLAASVVLDATNSVNCANAILETLAAYGIQHKHVLSVITDSARYMNKCVQTLQGLIEELHHTQCWAHKVSLVGDIFQDNLEELNTAIVRTKNAFLNARKRKSQYLAFLKAKHGEDCNEKGMLTAFPMPVNTRWCSWFKAVMYFSKHVDDLVEFFKGLDDGNAGVKYFKNAMPSDIQELKVLSLFVTLNCSSFVDLLTFLEGPKYPTAHLLCGKVGDIEVKLSILSTGNLNEEVNKEISKLPPKLQPLLRALLKDTAQLCLVKLRSLINADPSKKMFQSIGFLLNPRNATKTTSSQELKSYKRDIPFLKNVDSQAFLEGHAVFIATVKEELRKNSSPAAVVNVIDILCGLKESHPAYAQGALKSVWISCSNVDSERPFSTYSLVVSDRRRNLTPANAEILTMIAFD